MMKTPKYKDFAIDMMEWWQEDDLCADTLHGLALKHDLIYFSPEDDSFLRSGPSELLSYIECTGPPEVHAAEMCEAIKAAIYAFSDKMPLATAIGVLEIVKSELLDDARGEIG